MQDHTDLKRLKNAYILKCKELETASLKYPDLGEDMASKERDYRVQKGIVTLQLKEDGMQATLIPTIVNGKVADQRFDFKVAESMFHSCRENIKRLHANLDAYRSLLSVAKSEMEIR